MLRVSPARTVLVPYDEAADMTGQTDDALALMAYKGRTFDKQRRAIKHYVDGQPDTCCEGICLRCSRRRRPVLTGVSWT